MKKHMTDKSDIEGLKAFEKDACKFFLKICRIFNGREKEDEKYTEKFCRLRDRVMKKKYWEECEDCPRKNLLDEQAGELEKEFFWIKELGREHGLFYMEGDKFVSRPVGGWENEKS